MNFVLYAVSKATAEAVTILAGIFAGEAFYRIVSGVNLIKLFSSSSTELFLVSI
jgi:hypothetical protein